MKKFLSYILSSLFAVTFLPIHFMGCKKANGVKTEDILIIFKQKEGEPIAQVGKRILTVDELREDFLGRQGLFKGAPKYNTDKKRKEYLEDQVLQEAMFQEAVKLNYFNHADVKRDVKKIVVQRLMRDKLEEAKNNYTPSEEEIKEHYESNKNLYNRGDAVNVAYISVPFGSDKRNSKKVAAQLQKEALESVKNSNSKAFFKLAMKYAQNAKDLGAISIETNRTGYLEKGEFDKRFKNGAYEKAKKIENMGQVSPLFESKDSYVIFMKTGFRKALNETIKEAREKIVKRLSFKNRGNFYQDYVAQLRKKYDIKLYEEKLSQLSEDTQDDQEKLSANDSGHEHDHDHNHDQGHNH